MGHFGPDLPSFFKSYSFPSKCDQFILKKIIRIVATRCHILRVKCTKFDFGWGSAPDPAGGAYSAPPYPQLDSRDSTSKGREGKGGKGLGKGQGREEGGRGKGRKGKRKGRGEGMEVLHFARPLSVSFRRLCV